ncbi:MAG: bifunctional adenosylcobinamide kinase/adenosylcobinamide-phosphate guanylyltransferase [Epsilonproteobacteria bacterium]|nr:bifunctional adenosylcobinamide kinase/adenosylcobinamide-phosphate guanylyltransferase [Campylobacterota bacterium]
MKILYFGGQKSGKSLLAEKRAKELKGDRKPIYLATYDDSFEDREMRERIKIHQVRRADHFKTVCEPLKLASSIKEKEIYLIDCLSMWLLNAINAKLSKKEIFNEIERVLEKDADMIFVINDVGSGVIPMDRFTRDYVDLSGEIAQTVAAKCDEVYHVVLGIGKRLK